MTLITLPDKADLRRRALARRDAVSDFTRAEASAAIAESATTVLKVREGVVACYWPIRSEVDTRPIIKSLARLGYTVVLPVVIGRTTLEFRQYCGSDRLVHAGFGTMGPGPDAPVIDPDILLVPLSVFDRSGGRIGYGAGHYDRAFARLEAMRPVTAIALAFACQEAVRVPTETHDRRMDLIITEDGVITPGETG